MTQFFARRFGLPCLLVFFRGVLLPLGGCGSAEGVATQSEVLQRCAERGYNEDVVETLIIAAEVDREAGFTKSELLSGALATCSADEAPIACLNCLTSIIDYVYD